MIKSIHAEKNFDKIQHPFIIFFESPQKTLRIEFALLDTEHVPKKRIYS